jgi:hypothetical protein
MVVDVERIETVCAQINLAQQVNGLTDYVRATAKEGCAAHTFEEGIWRRLLALGLQLTETFFACVGDGDMGEEVQLADGRTVRRLPELHSREYRSVFGLIAHDRVVYGTREGQKIEYVPFDAWLALPASKFSYLLQNWDQAAAVDASYAQVSEQLRRILGFSQSVDSLERMNRKMAEATPDFLEALPAPEPETEGALVVSSADGKGVPMCGGGAHSPIEDHRPQKGPKPNSKKMALLGTVYTVDPVPRTPEEVVASLFRAPQEEVGGKPKRPQPCHKRLRASLARSDADTTEPAVEEIFAWMAQEVQVRNPGQKKPRCHLMDGQESLWAATEAHLPQDDRVDILDLLHVTPRLWKAAYLFHPERSPAAVQFVKDQVLRILRGEVRGVTQWMRWLGMWSGLEGKKKEQLATICGFFENNQDRMRYDEYLQAGYPIATGVIEGACRHLVKDRLERAGMRWVLAGAQSMLHVRSLYITGLWDEFTAYRIKKETERLYPELADHEPHQFACAA